MRSETFELEDESLESSATFTDSTANTPKDYLSQSPTSEMNHIELADFHRRRPSGVTIINNSVRRRSIDSNSSISPRYRGFLSPRLKGDLWGTLLVPCEPDPDDFDSFHDFEEAYKRWAAVVSNLPIIPPHTTQLQDLIPIVPPVIPVNRNDKGENIPRNIDTSKKIGLIEIKFLDNEVPLNKNINNKTNQQLKLDDIYESEDDYIEESVLLKIQELFDKLIQSSKNLKESNDSFIQENPYMTYQSQEYQYYPYQTCSIDGLKFRNDVLRRNPNNNENQKPLDVVLPDYDISNIDYKKLIEDKDYRLLIKNGMNSLRTNIMIKYKKSNNVTDEVLMQMKNFIQNDSFGYEDVYNIFSKNINLLDFKSLFYDKGSIKLKPFAQTFIDKIDERFVSYLLEIYSSSPDENTHIKLSYILTELLKLKSFESIFNYYMTKIDIKSISLIVYSIIQLESPYIDVYPYRDEVISLFKKYIGCEYNDILESFYLYYYIGLLHRIVKNNHAYYINKDYIISLRSSSIKKLLNLLKSKPNFVKNHLIQTISHRSKYLSSLFLMITTKLLNEADSMIKSFIIEEDFPSLNSIEQLSFTKYPHSKSACQHLYNVFLSSNEYINYIYNKIRSNHLLDQIIKPQYNFNSTFYTFVKDIIMKRLYSAISNNETDTIQYIIDNDRYHNLLNIIKDSKTENEHLIIHNLRFFQALSKAASLLNQFSSSLIKRQSNVILIGMLDIQDLINLLKNPLISDSLLLDEYNVLLLSSLRYILKTHSIFDSMKRNESLYMSISKFCRSQHDQTCKEAWKSFYQIIKYHPGIVDLLIKKRLITYYFDHLSVSSGYLAMKYSIHYLTKVFLLPPSDSKRNLSTKKKNADVKSIISYFIQIHLFIKIHIMYKKLIDEKGAAFTELVNLYVALDSSPNCKKLFKEVSKSDDFRDGIKKLCQMAQLTPLVNSEKDIKSKKSLKLKKK